MASKYSSGSARRATIKAGVLPSQLTAPSNMIARTSGGKFRNSDDFGGTVISRLSSAVSRSGNSKVVVAVSTSVKFEMWPGI